MARAATGHTTLRPDLPAARMAVISPSPDIRLKVSRHPTSTPIGTVKMSAGGRTRPDR